MAISPLIFSFDFETSRDWKIVKGVKKFFNFVYFWVLDCEDGRHWEGNDLSSFIDTLEEVKEKKLIYGHNSRKFDLKFLFPEILKREKKDKIKYQWGEAGIYSLNYKGNRFLDTSNFYHAPLEKLIKGMNKPEWETIKAIPQRWNTQKFGHVAKELEKQRCRVDSLATLELAKRVKETTLKLLNKYFEKEGKEFKRTFLTMGSLRFNELRSHFSKEEWKELFPQFKWLDDEFRPFYRGGLVDNLNETTYRKKVWMHDRNHIYPYVMLNFSLPYGIPSRQKTEKYNYGKYTIECRKVECSKFPFIQIPVHHPKIYGEKRLISPKIIENEVIYLEEWEFDLFKKHYKGEWKIIKQNFFKSKKGIFDEFLLPWQKIKENSKRGSIDYNEAKFIGVSTYGKFGQNAERSTYRLRRIREKEEVQIEYYDRNRNYLTPRKEDTIIPCFRYIPLASAITSIARYLLVDMIIRVGWEKVLYYDTDCLITKEPIPEEYIHETELGKWKLVGEYLGYSSRGAKSYYLITDKSKHKYDVIVNKGLPINDVSFEDYVKDVKLFSKARISRVDGTGVEIYEGDGSIPSFSDNIKRKSEDGFWKWITTIPPSQKWNTGFSQRIN